MTTALITGASNGIGLEIAKRLAKQDINLVLVARSADKLKQIAEELTQSSQIKCIAMPLDLTQTNAVETLYQSLEHTEIDLLINNAGCGDFGLFHDVDWQKYQQTINLNMTVLTEMTHRFLPQMIARNHGQVVNIASTAAFQPLPWMAVYAATKSYVLSLSEALAYELKDSQIKVLAICPGATNTGFASAAEGGQSNNFTESNMSTVSDVADFAVQKILEGQGGVAVHGLKNKVMSILAPMSPKAVVLHMAASVMKPF